MKISTVSKASDSNLYTKKELIAWIYEVTNVNYYIFRIGCKT